MPEESIIIGGAGHAGVQTAVRLRELGWSGRIVMIAPDADEPYERPPLSKHFLEPGAPVAMSPLRRRGYFESKAIERRRGHIERVVRAERYVLLEDGSRLGYGKLVLAPGPVRPPADGSRW